MMNYKNGRELKCFNFKYEDVVLKYYELSYVIYLSFMFVY